MTNNSKKISAGYAGMKRTGCGQFTKAYNPLIYSVVLEILHSREDAEDVTSEFFIRLWEYCRNLSSGKRPSGVDDHHSP